MRIRVSGPCFISNEVIFFFFLAWKHLTVFGITAQLEVFTGMPQESDKTTIIASPLPPLEGFFKSIHAVTKGTEEQGVHSSGNSTVLVFKLY